MSLSDHPMRCDGVMDEPDIQVEIINVNKVKREIDDEKIMAIGPPGYRESYRRVARGGSRRWYLENPPDDTSEHLTLHTNLILESLYQREYDDNETSV